VAKYDAFCEILPEALSSLDPDLNKFNYCVDLYGMKPLDLLLQEQHVLTIKNANNPLKTFGREMLPVETNILHQVEGNRIRFTASNSCTDIPYTKKLIDKQLIVENLLYHNELSQLTLRQLLDTTHDTMSKPLLNSNQLIDDNDIQNENALLLLQLHQVQEELEEYYLKYQILKNQTAKV
jgi:hypothetical protein